MAVSINHFSNNDRESNNNANISAHFKYTNGTKDPYYISNILCIVFTNFGTNHANAIPKHKQTVSKYFLN